MARNIEATFIDDETYPPSESATGNNAYYFRCEMVQHSTPYCVCLNHIAERKNGRLDTIYSTCSAAIGRRDCPALAMQKREKEEGKAVFFINRRKRREFFAQEGELLDSVPQEKWSPPQRRTVSSSVSRSTPSAPVAPQAPAAPKVSIDSSNIYAEAINAALASQKQDEPAAPKSAIMNHSPVTNAGAPMSPLALARLMSQKG